MTKAMLRWQLTAVAVALALGAGCRDRPAVENPSATKAEAPPPGTLERPASEPVAKAAPNAGAAVTNEPDAAKNQQPLAAGAGDNTKKSF
ncbi:MAG: hypothetical protein FJ143_15855 [Deltaproteobacteria bacterium]|nr:hypothetical protein [Deltaproteobacteria bacterium]MBM4299211.1 hypothetical protein [Deltaproteobacteria bacterium]